MDTLTIAVAAAQLAIDFHVGQAPYIFRPDHHEFNADYTLYVDPSTLYVAVSMTYPPTAVVR